MTIMGSSFSRKDIIGKLSFQRRLESSQFLLPDEFPFNAEDMAN